MKVRFLAETVVTALSPPAVSRVAGSASSWEAQWYVISMAVGVVSGEKLAQKKKVTICNIRSLPKEGIELMQAGG